MYIRFKLIEKGYTKEAAELAVNEWLEQWAKKVSEFAKEVSPEAYEIQWRIQYLGALKATLAEKWIAGLWEKFGLKK